MIKKGNGQENIPLCNQKSVGEQMKTDDFLKVITALRLYIGCLLFYKPTFHVTSKYTDN